MVEPAATGESHEQSSTHSPPTSPHLAEMAAAHAATGRDYADAFEFGLDLILDSLAARLSG